jgi:hypothetical protein
MIRAGTCVCGVVLLLAACAPAPDMDDMSRNLTQRLNERLAANIAGGTAAVAQTPDGAQVTLANAVLFPPGSNTALNAGGQTLVTGVIQGLLAPKYMQVQIAGDPAAPEYVRAQQVDAVSGYFEGYLLGPSLRPVSIAPAPLPVGPVGASAPGFAIAIHVAPSGPYPTQ